MIPAKRPSEIVRDYIEAEFFGSAGRPDGRLPTIQEFSEHLNVSHSTVRSVIKALAEEGKVSAIPGKGTFLTHRAGEEAAPALQGCFGINIPNIPGRIVGRAWLGHIVLAATEEALKANMMVTALDMARQTGAGLKEVRKALDRVDGVIVCPGPRNHAPEVEKACAEKGLPMVYINPPHFLHTADFVSNDYFTAAYHLALAWRKTGRRNVALVFEGPLWHSISAEQTFTAFSLAYASCQEARLRVLDGECFDPMKEQTTCSEEIGYRRIKRYLERHGGDLDAVYCFGDYLAQGAVKAFLEAGRDVPQEVSVVGGTGIDLQVPMGPLVTLRQPMAQIGREAARMMIWKIRNRPSSAPGIYLLPELTEGCTIRPEEHAAYAELASVETRAPFSAGSSMLWAKGAANLPSGRS